jgi:hypothetical protein
LYPHQKLNSSFLTVDEAGSIMPETPEAALVAAQAYMLNRMVGNEYL